MNTLKLLPIHGSVVASRAVHRPYYGYGRYGTHIEFAVLLSDSLQSLTSLNGVRT
jgi:hypothetical protein